MIKKPDKFTMYDWIRLFSILLRSHVLFDRKDSGKFCLKHQPLSEQTSNRKATGQPIRSPNFGSTAYIA
ncbi:hypothetical protein BRADI_3g52099v3 [Brachypodium distachyon]|uniref:Uncharacterized protein n=1 Tax=Brachypodium distachyon TaxID=15368 RepID=A0A2K2D4P5_BRADI|nr:hypothetical protein BRADI_3g52099v3 [Brachypodium distachyon]